ncbi:MAG: hypothetical protein B7Z09_00535 [Brevundimonas diminuta]|nr:MAG: hypothetical protein B7Z09_00535 [Brevundimonas diminuta]
MLDRDALDRRGFGTVAEALTDLPQNYAGSATPVVQLAGSDRGGSNAVYATGINLRGLGPASTLVLVNGRRLAGTGFRGEFADASALPSAAVERVDVLLDGASALYRSNAVSPAGAAGLTQLMPATARELGVEDRFDPVENLRGGADYLARQLRRFQDVRLALAAFNAGPARVASLGRVPRIRETEEYVESVIECYLALSAGRVVVNARQCRREGAP